MGAAKRDLQILRGYRLMRNTLHLSPDRRILYYAVLVLLALALILPALYCLPQALDSTTEVILCS